MARIRHLNSREEYWVNEDFSIGRAPSCALVLDSPRVSARHAELRWREEGWQLGDSSRNGTFVNGERIPKGGHLRVEAGTRISFGGTDDIFEFIDADRPRAHAVSEDGTERVEEDGLLVLPDPDAPRVTISATEAGQWLAEWNDGSTKPVSHRATMSIGATSWDIQVPMIVAPTIVVNDDQLSMGQLSMRFRVSRDQETVAIRLQQGKQQIELRPRAHGYLLWILARERLADQDNPELPEVEHGWMHVEELMDMLRTDDNNFNVSIWRARKQFAKAGVKQATALIERRTGARKIRIGTGNITIES